MKKSELAQKVTEHSVLIKETREDVRQIKTNDLPHIRRRIDWVLGLIISGLIGAIYFLIKLI